MGYWQRISTVNPAEQAPGALQSQQHEAQPDAPPQESLQRACSRARPAQQKALAWSSQAPAGYEEAPFSLWGHLFIDLKKLK